MRVWLWVLVVGCSKSAEPPPVENTVPPLTSAEIQRSRDACADYVTRACECAKSVPAAKDLCGAARSMPDAVKIAIGVASSPDTAPRDAVDAQRNVRKAVAECIEQTAKLPTLGCP